MKTLYEGGREGLTAMSRWLDNYLESGAAQLVTRYEIIWNSEVNIDVPLQVLSRLVKLCAVTIEAVALYAV